MWKFEFLDVFADELKEIQTLDVVEEELKLSLDEVYAIFKEEHDSSTLEPIYNKGFTLLKELHNPTPMDPSHYDNFSLNDHFGELVLSSTSYTSKFCSRHPNEVWVKGFFLMVPHEEYVIPMSPFDDGMHRVPYYLHFSEASFVTL